jgi:hypothetical protein
MIYWMIVLVSAVMVLIQQAVGVAGAALAVVVFMTALFLLSAGKIGYRAAWTRFGLDRLVEPLLKSENWARLVPLFEDAGAVFVAATVAVVLVALSLTAPTDIVVVGALTVLALGIIEVLRSGRQHARLTAPKLLGHSEVSYAQAAE